MSTTSKKNVGPGDLQSQPGSPFLLSSTEWASIQTYVADALALPTTNEEMKTNLSMPASEPIAPFVPIVQAYHTINTHCSKWKDHTYPATVNLADDIIHYNGKVPIYYGAINKLLPALEEPTPPDEVVKEFKAIVDNLATQAKSYAKNAETVEAAITSFSDKTTEDKAAITGLKTTFNEEYGSKSSEVVTLGKEMWAQQKILIAENKAYNHDVVVATTTLTYAWVPFYGWIAGPIVAGVYGHRAVEALKKANEARKKLDQYKGEIKRDTILMHTITLAETGLSTILSDIINALAVIKKIKGVWSAISSDLTNMGVIIEQDIKQALPIIMNLGIDEAISEWAKLAHEANDYRVNAYVTFEKKKGA